MINELKFYIDNGWSGIGLSTLHAYLVIKENKGMTRNEMAQVFDISLDQVSNMMHRLTRLGLLIIDNEKKPHIYHAISLEN